MKSYERNLKEHAINVINNVNIGKNAVKLPRNVLPLLITSTTKSRLRASSLHKQSSYKNALKYALISFHIKQKKRIEIMLSHEYFEMSPKVRLKVKNLNIKKIH